ncbi:PREDICTED: uncharacterized protein LOC104609816 isoform X2 [Nelumbo nucifera]|uniref:tRNA (guanosine(18)-2'-O)-methyltransferase TARBP1 n=1 Tax=Nelumbo nucifera TaxID=4432 RepID=A0A1U8B500_NELNU|nr:PREDICTED: uncharacterized protein LOC104609816 isoform X2 [Nelumbo nucifera]
MSTPIGDSMSSPVDSLTMSFGLVPPTAVPAILDCILSSTRLSPSLLFSSLLDAFSNVIKDDSKEEHEKLDSAYSSRIVSFASALCHLLKKSGTNPDSLRSFIWKGFFPVIKIYSNDYELLNQIAELLFAIVVETNTWGVLEATLVPICLMSIGHSLGMLQNEDSTIFQWDMQSIILESTDKLSYLNIEKELLLSHFGSLPLPVSCHILTSLLFSALRSHQAVHNTSEPVVANGCCAGNFAGKLLWHLCDMSIQILLQSSEHRFCAIHLLLPFVFRAFVSHSHFEIAVHGKKHVLSREYLFTKIWKCCKTLLSLGPLERRDAYNVLSLYLSSSLHMDGCEVSVCNGEDNLDLKSEKEFWDEIKRGLVDKEGFVRKQSFHILKTALSRSGGSQCCSGVSEATSFEKSSTSCGMTKRAQWAEKEAKSLGVGKIYNSASPCLNSQQRWDAFLLLYEMLEEYGTHLVEAAWTHQITLLLHFSCPHDYSLNSKIEGSYQFQMETLEGIFSWLAVLWERGFCHENPQVRCLIMQSFLGIDWKNHGEWAKLVPKSFVLGPFIQGLNDTVHHKDFGVKGIYSSTTIEGAASFFCQFSSYLCGRELVAFLFNLASVAKVESFGRAGLMALSVCIASAACGAEAPCEREAQLCENDSFNTVQVDSDSSEECVLSNCKADLLDALRLIIEGGKQHFNPNYRLRVCEKVLEVACSMMCPSDVPLEILMHFLSSLPREFTDFGGVLIFLLIFWSPGSFRGKVQKWFSGCNKKDNGSSTFSAKMQVLKSLHDFPKRFINHHYSHDTYDDEDLKAWALEAQRWTRLLFLVFTEEQHFEPIFMFLQNCGINICNQKDNLEWIPVKFLILAFSLVQELQMVQDKYTDFTMKVRSHMAVDMPQSYDELSTEETFIVSEKVRTPFLFILEDFVSFAKSACSIFWSSPIIEDLLLPCSVRGKLGGPSQRRLASSTTMAVLQAIESIRTIASISSWCARFQNDSFLGYAFTFLWRSFARIISCPTFDSEMGAEIRLASYEALVPVLKALGSAFPLWDFNSIMTNDESLLPKLEGKPLLDSWVSNFLNNINDLLAVGILARSRRAVLMNWKWHCLDSLLSIPYHAIKNGVHLCNNATFFSDAALRCIFSDIIESLENAGENSVLPMLRSVRFVLGISASERISSLVSSCDGLDIQIMWQLVHSSWLLHVSCNKRKVAPIAALLSSVLHISVFCDESMHETADNAQGPLKWFVKKILDEGGKSPRTIRLAALHLTGLWLLYPRIIKYYIKELKLLALYGSVAFDEDFEAELAEQDARTEVLLLAKSPDPELTEAFINTELYARVCVAVLFEKLADLSDGSGLMKRNEDCSAALESGKLFLLELIDSVVNDKDLSKELYKKYSAIHRRKVRAWQMLCILSRFVDEDIVQEVTSSLHICLYRNNLPAVRQYLETFAINIYLKFPFLVREQLIPIFLDYNMRTQALSSYVFIATNIILHTSEMLLQFRHLNDLLPPIIPLLTSHHHSLRGFTQLLVYHVLCKLVPELDSDVSEVPLEKKCFQSLKSYLMKNSDCMRLRASMEGFLDVFSPKASTIPAGIFTARDEESEFECVPLSLMEQVIAFLNDAREDLRCNMAKDIVTIKNESLTIGGSCNGMEILLKGYEEALPSQVPKDLSLDFQKKVTPKHESQDSDEYCQPLLEMEKEDQLLSQVLQSRTITMERIKSSRQQLILVASLLDRIPNLAGLARTCEVFKAAGLAIADASIISDKQFQLISVTAEKWVPIIEVPPSSVKVFLERKKREGFSILGLEQTANSIPLDQYTFPKKTVLVLGREKEGIPVDIIHVLDACVEIPQLGVVRSLNVHVSGAIALWEYTRQQRSQKS